MSVYILLYVLVCFGIHLFFICHPDIILWGQGTQKNIRNMMVYFVHFKCLLKRFCTFWWESGSPKPLGGKKWYVIEMYKWGYVWYYTRGWWCNLSVMCEHEVIIDPYWSLSFSAVRPQHTLTKTHTPTERQWHLCCSYRAENQSSTMTHYWLNVNSSQLSRNILFMLTPVWGYRRFFILGLFL